MFFVGITGQLITLILTVCLPFVFLMSDSQAANIQKPTLQIHIHQNHHETLSFDFYSHQFEQDYFAEESAKNLKIEDSDFIKIPHLQFRVNNKLFHLNCSGNKAPPASIYFSC